MSVGPAGSVRDAAARCSPTSRSRPTCESLESEAEAHLVVTRITNAFTTPFVVDDIAISVTASVGSATPAPGETITKRPVVDVDLAMYEAKDGDGRGFSVAGRRLASRHVGSGRGRI